MNLRSISKYSLVLVLMGALSLSACGKDADDNQANQNQVNQNQANQNQENQENQNQENQNQENQNQENQNQANQNQENQNQENQNQENQNQENQNQENQNQENQNQENQNQNQGDLEGCDYVGFDAAFQDLGPMGQGMYFYLAQTTLDTPFDSLEIEFLEGLPEVGTVILDDANYGDCTTCMVIYQDCPDVFEECGKAFLVQEGTMEIATSGEDADQLTGVIKDAVFAEITVDYDTWESTLVEDGETWCIPEYEIDAEIQ